VEEKKYPQFIINPPDYKNAIKAGREIYIQFYHVTPEVESLIVKSMHVYLEQYDILYIKDMLITVVKELVNNAVKANIKRVYFREKNLDINDIESYRQGMETFKDETYGEQMINFDRLAAAKMVVRISFSSRNDNIIIHVINNAPILDEELKKIDARSKKAYKYTDISEAFDDVLDDSEGAGLGLIMALMLFKNAGLPAESFKVMRKEKLTVATLTIPRKLNKIELHSQIAGEIVSEIESLPSFPAHIKEIQRLCAIPESKIKDISDQIKRDPGLTTNILKIANSAGYMTINRVETIEEAVMKIGLKGINTLLVASGVQKIMESRYKKFETIWKNSYKSAFYAQRIAMQVKKANLIEFVYLAALLSAIGRLVMLSIKPEVTERIRQMVGIKGLGDTGLLEEISLGISHSTLGGYILKKWNFNEALIKTVEFHNRPHMAPEKFRDLIYIVYLANALIDIEFNKSRFEILDDNVLERFNLASKDEFNATHNVLKQAYEVQSQEIK
jgi:HD-like signal output (HDOD) protein